ncbi:MarR family winged helix-turn-helix transcriptional regulator [Amycolatopsis pithecellobii]|uniref:MarR family transcriptional regulator n=1 Tax=Amycolatopsis pithecellobii TaxID=664692 RepID=A0A6N7Z0L5_9PSEU|nr:MarR family winged helix-turn-helix transcriptional regulator [Amycolatopsis pithecellobii]MTD53140.1 MarR family transcriptional regulator [Amycolatopsis pithecellobii]
MSAQQHRVWQTFVLLSEAVRREVGRDLAETSGLSDADFTVLAELAHAPGGTMRSTHCARALDWDTGRLSHQLRRMQERGLITRARGDASDARAAVVTITDAGRIAYRDALAPHLRSARYWFLDGIESGRLDEFDATLTAVLDHVQQRAAERG